MLELTEETAKSFIESAPFVIIKGWGDNCGYCTTYAPVFEKIASEFKGAAFGSIKLPNNDTSEFRKNYMKSKPGEKSGIPCTFLFKDGELLDKHHGSMTEEQLLLFITTQAHPIPQQRTIEQLSLTELKAAAYENIVQIEGLKGGLQALQAEIQKREQPK